MYFLKHRLEWLFGGLTGCKAVVGGWPLRKFCITVYHSERDYVCSRTTDIGSFFLSLFVYEIVELLEEKHGWRSRRIQNPKFSLRLQVHMYIVYVFVV